jgi:diguanylate cyclase (GGDEF)-like protein
MSILELDPAHAARSRECQAGPSPDAAAGSGERVLAGMRRLMRLADGAGQADEIMRALAGELFLLLGADEVHVHRLAPPSADERSGSAAAESDPVVVYLFGGEGRLSYELPRAERPPGVAWVASTGQCVRAQDPSELAAVLPRVAATGSGRSAVLLPLTVHGQVEAVVAVVRGRAGGLPEPVTGQAAALVDQAAAALALLRARAEAGTDAVTGCMNHRAMRRRLAEEIGRVARSGGRLSCLLLDLDDFKLVNDRHGHPAGDALLREVARALTGEFRAFDRVARYGGDEFVVILPDADADSAASAAERALARLAALPSYDVTPGVRASIGVAQWHAPMRAEDLLRACDEALLRVKRDGKGSVARAA